MRGLAVLVLVSCCDGGSPSPQPPAPQLARRDPIGCGEPRPVATALPEAVRKGTQRVGEATVTAGETKHVGTVSLHYDPDHWNGSRSAGSRGPALVTEVDRVEVGEHAPWGASTELRPGHAFRFYVGAYRFDARASAERPPAHVAIAIERRPCPESTVTENQREPLAMWVSTEAIRLHTLQDGRGMLQILVESAVDEPPMIQVQLGLWSHRMEPRAGEQRAFRIDDRVVVVDAVERSKQANGPDRVHARARVEAATMRPVEAEGPAGPCAAAASMRTALPAELAHAHAQLAEVMLVRGAARTVANTTLELIEQTIPGRGRRPPEAMLRLYSAALTQPTMMFGNGTTPQLNRSDRAIFRFDPEPARVRVRAFAAACAPALTIPMPDRPAYVWLSTVGVQTVLVGAPQQPALSLRLYPEDSSPSFGASSEHATDSQQLRPALVGHVATMDGLRIEVVDVVASGSTRLDGTRWLSPTGLVEVHVQVRISSE